MTLLLLITALLFFIYLSKETMRIIRKTLHPEFKRKPKDELSEGEVTEESISEDENEPIIPPYGDTAPTIVDFPLEQPPVNDDIEEESDIKA